MWRRRALLPRLAAERGSAPRLLVFHYDLPAELARTADELEDVLRWLRSSCGIERLVLAGDSAGGFLCVNHLLRCCGSASPAALAPLSRADAVVAFYPVLDMSSACVSLHLNAHLDGLHQNLLTSGTRAFLRQATVEEVWTRGSPQAHPTHGSPSARTH